jgi:hypothetical protein
MAWTREYKNKYQREWRAKNLEKNREQNRKNLKNFREKNPGYNAEHTRNWRKKNPEKASETNKKNLKAYRIRHRNNPIYRMQQSMRSALCAALSGRRKAQPTMDIIGCTVEELFEHLESCPSWESWMTRENYGKNGWDVDHIIPISKWSKNCPLQFALCWDKSNLQPLEHIANIKKGGR